MSKIIASLLWIFWTSIVINMLFLKGYLLSRIEIDKISTCSQFIMPNSSCWSEPLVKKAVLILVDALRHDFTIYNSSISPDILKTWQNKMPIFSELRSKYPENVKHFKFIADPPSATFLRLKGLTTGGLPTFIDLGSNFGASEITEDSWVKQLALNNKKLIFMGDDTWMGIYGKYFHKAYPFPSFDVWDLHTVDNGVWENLIPSIKTNDWDVIVAHFLGVDHAGHRYDVNNPELGRKLVQVNNWIEEVIPHIDEETMVFIFGDHGMTTSGDHGGETYDEVTSSLFVYSGSPLPAHHFPLPDVSSVFQTDLVPTLTLLLGVPIPYSSIGQLIPALFPVAPGNVLLKNYMANLKQVIRYIEAYALLTNDFDVAEINNYKVKAKDLEKKLLDNDDFSLDLYEEVVGLLSEIRKLCVERWARFDLTTMMIAIMLSLLLMIIFLGCLAKKGVLEATWYGIIPPVIALFIAYDTSSPWNGISNFVTVAATIALSYSYASSSLRKAYHHLSTATFRVTPSQTMSLIVLFFIACGFTTNSYILVEDYATLFFIGSIVVVVTLENCCRVTGRTAKGKEIALGVVVSAAARLSASYYGCREEQFWCDKPIWMSEDKNVVNRLYFGGVVSLASTLVLLYWAQKRRGSMAIMTPNRRLQYYYIQPLVCFLIAVYWALSATNSTVLTDTQLCWLPRTVYVLTFISMALTLRNPVMVYVVAPPDKTSLPVMFGGESCISSPFLALYGCLVPSLTLLLGFKLCPVLLLCTVELLGCCHLLRRSPPLTRVVMLHLVTLQLFYATGHQAAIQSFDWNAAFVGFTSHSHNVVPGILIALRTLMTVVITTVWFPVVMVASRVTSNRVSQVDMTDSDRGDTGDLRFLVTPHALSDVTRDHTLTLAPLLVWKCVWAFISCYLHRRHLMVWNIFTPRAVLELALSSSYLLFLTLVHVALHRILTVLRPALKTYLTD